MTAIPATFRAYVAEKVPDSDPPRVRRGVREVAEADLPPGEVEIRVDWSSVNYKDGLATRADGKVARISPLIPGIDLAGEVVSSSDPSIVVGTAVLAHGYELGVSRHGGYSEYQRVPAGWVVPLAAGLAPRDAMSIGTAGFTAAMSVSALEARGLEPADGPVLVTGASGGVGGTAVAILAERGYEVWAATGKDDEADRLRDARGGRDPDPRRGDRRRAGRSTRNAGRAPSTRSARPRCRTSFARCGPERRSRPRATPAGPRSRPRSSRSSSAAWRCSGWIRWRCRSTGDASCGIGWRPTCDRARSAAR